MKISDAAREWADQPENQLSEEAVENIRRIWNSWLREQREQVAS